MKGLHVVLFLLAIVMLPCAFAALHLPAPYSLTIQVYFASAGKNNEDFISKQLYPTYVAINKGYLPMDPPLKLDFIPYANCFESKVPNDIRTTCAYNKLHACSISLSRNENNWTPLNFANCIIMTRQAGKEDISYCAVKTCFDDRQMSPCVNSVDGDQLLIAHRNRTMAANVPTADLPIVTFDGIFKEAEQTKARTNLLALVCEKTMYQSPVCRKPRATATMTHNNFGSGFHYPERVHCYFWINNWHW